MSTEPLFKIEQSEAVFQASVEQLATTLGWEWMHIRPGMNERGRYRTPISGTLGAGWPDLVLVKADRLIFAECKSQKGKLTGRQVWVLNTLEATGHEVFCWRPSDWDDIVKILQRGPFDGSL